MILFALRPNVKYCTCASPAGRAVAPEILRVASLVLLIFGGALLAGCAVQRNNQPFISNPVKAPPATTGAPEIDPTAVPVRDDVVSVYNFWQSVPWLQDPSSGKAVGFRVLSYFVSSQSERGAFVSGPITVLLNEIVPTATGDVERRLLYTWSLDQAQATGFRVRKVSVLGYHYGFVLNWPPNVDPSGKRIEVQIAYNRADGRTIQSAAHSMIVPAPAILRPRGTVRANP